MKQKKQFNKKQSNHKEFGKKEFGKKEFGRKEFNKKEGHKPKFSKPDFQNSRQSTAQKPRLSAKAPQPLLVWGKHVVESFLNNLNEQVSQDSFHHSGHKFGSYLLHVLIDKSGQIPTQLSQICEMAKALTIKVLTHRSEEEGWPLAEVHEGIVHQRVCLQVPEYPTKSFLSVCDAVKEYNDTKQFCCSAIVLDQVQDPRNFGAIIRSAAFFGIKFVIYAQNRQADLSPLVLKASAGGAFEVNLVPVVNINRALEDLQQAGAWILGTANTPEAVKLTKLPTDRVWVCVFGNEGTGLRQEVIKHCDFMTKISGGTKTLDSLNVSVAAGIVMQSLQEKSSCLD